MWFFPIVMPIVMLTVFLVVIYLVFGRGSPHSPWFRSCAPHPPVRGEGETALGILKKRYARGDITREEFERTRNDLE